jgi:hypothetical protein
MLKEMMAIGLDCNTLNNESNKKQTFEDLYRLLSKFNSSLSSWVSSSEL